MQSYIFTVIGLLIAMAIFVWAWRAGYFLKLSGYFRETQEELRKCTWPTWEELQQSTVIVVVAIALLGGFTIGIDFVISWIIQAIV